MALSPLPGPDVILRPATTADAPILAAWDRQPHVIACSNDDPQADVAFGSDWAEEVTNSAYELTYLMAEVDGRPVGLMAVCDPHTEPSHYWGQIEPGLRAIDIWIGPAEWLGRGVGTRMMTRMIDRCFAEPEVTAIVIDPLNSNVDAHRFYRRLGFEVLGRRMFDQDDCLVMRLEKADWAARPSAVERTYAANKSMLGDRDHEPFPLEGGRVGMGVEVAASNRVSATPSTALASTTSTPIPGPSPLQGEGGASSTSDDRRRNDIEPRVTT